MPLNNDAWDSREPSEDIHCVKAIEKTGFGVWRSETCTHKHDYVCSGTLTLWHVGSDLKNVIFKLVFRIYIVYILCFLGRWS